MSGPAPQAKLDPWSIVGRTSAAEAHLAVALDLRELALQDIEEIATCRALRVCLLGANLLSQVGSAIFNCRRLQKLDLSGNGLTTLPPKTDWANLSDLLILYLHDNHLAALPAAGELIGCAMLLRLTLYGNPLAKHPSYRHYCVNTLISLRALDLHVISDEELIEGATFSDSFGTKCVASELPVFAPPLAPPEGQGAAGPEPNDTALLANVQQEIRALNAAHARLSPVLRLQAAARAAGARRRVRALRESLGASPPGRGADEGSEEGSSTPASHAAAADSAEPEPPPAAPELSNDDAAALLHKERAATRVQSQVRGHQQRKLLEGSFSGEQTAKHEANLGLAGAPFLYIQTRHVLELEALLPAALGVENAKASYFEPTDCYVIRHSSEAPEVLAEPPLVGMLIRQRSAEPEPVALRLTPNSRELYTLGRMRRYARATEGELRIIRAGLEYAMEGNEQDASVVQKVYARRQLVRLVLPSADLFDAVFGAADRRNAHLLEAMGVAEGDERSPKVISEMLMPLTPQVLDVVLATVTLQRVWRSISVRSKLVPSLTQRLLRGRAAVRMQRWWRWWLLKERLRMLRMVRERVLAVDSNKLYLPTAIFEDLDGPMPLHTHRLWPEHSSLKFTFAHSQHSELQYFVTADSLRPEMPTWCAPKMPVAVARSLKQPQEPLSLLSVGVRAALVPKVQFRPFVKRDWTCVCFQSQVEATRRVALLTAIGYEPLALRTRHGRLQGCYFYPLHLLSWGELERSEAAACIQGAWMAKVARKAFVAMLNVAKERRAVFHQQRELEKASNSLMAQKGELSVTTMQVPPPASDHGAYLTAADAAAQLNLSREQLERMLVGQAQVLGVYGLPPVVAPSGEMGSALAEQLTREANTQREEAAAARALVRERRAAEVAAAREATLAAAREKAGVSPGGGGVGGGGFGPDGPAGVPGGGAAGAAGPGGPAPHPPSARALMQMMQSVVAHRSEMYDDSAAMQARISEAKRSHAANLRAELRQAHAELVADRELERQELLVQSRLERRQLQHALDERNRAFAAEVVQKYDSRRQHKDALLGRAAARAFTGGFVRQQNAMVRQLQLGDLRRRKQDEEVSVAQHAAQARKEQEAWKARAASEARRRAEAAREERRQDKAELEAKRESLAMTRDRELQMVKMKQQQLHDIKMMLAQPVDLNVPSAFGNSHLSFGGPPSPGADDVMPTPAAGATTNVEA